MGIFGRRRAPEYEKHIVPPELWEDPESAAFFKRIGARPDDPDNLRVMPDDVVRMIEEGRKALDARIRQLQAKASAKGLDDLRLRPFWLIQDNCWNGEVGEFLVYQLRLNPHEEWNTVILPADERTASILDMPIHPGGDIPHLAETGRATILALRDRYYAAHEEARRTHEFGHLVDLHDDTVAKVKRLAQLFKTKFAEVYQDIRRKRAEGRAALP